MVNVWRKMPGGEELTALEIARSVNALEGTTRSAINAASHPASTHSAAGPTSLVPLSSPLGSPARASRSRATATYSKVIV